MIMRFASGGLGVQISSEPGLVSAWYESIEMTASVQRKKNDAF